MDTGFRSPVRLASIFDPRRPSPPAAPGPSPEPRNATGPGPRPRGRRELGTFGPGPVLREGEVGGVLEGGRREARGGRVHGVFTIQGLSKQNWL